MKLRWTNWLVCAALAGGGFAAGRMWVASHVVEQDDRGGAAQGTRRQHGSATSDAGMSAATDRPFLNEWAEHEFDEFGIPSLEAVAASQITEEQAAGSAPERLPDPSSAAPIAKRPSRSVDAVIREIIQQEMPDATPQQREIWLKQFRHLPPEAVLFTLQLRRSVGRREQAQRGRLPATASSVRNGSPEPAVQSTGQSVLREFHAETREQLQPSIEALRQARNIILNNIANADTTAFQRRRVLMSAWHNGSSREPGQPVASRPSGVTLAGTNLDFSQGRLQATACEFDLAIEGRGFFEIRSAQGTAYTRLGRFELNAQRQLVLRAAGRLWKLQPVIAIPEAAKSVSIQRNGGVLVLISDSDDPSRVGRIQIASFVCPARLKPLGSGLYEATRPAGPPQGDSPGTGCRGFVRQRFLELSNVVLERELRDLAQLKRHLQALAAATDLFRDNTTRADSSRDLQSRGSNPKSPFSSESTRDPAPLPRHHSRRTLPRNPKQSAAAVSEHRKQESRADSSRNWIEAVRRHLRLD